MVSSSHANIVTCHRFGFDMNGMSMYSNGMPTELSGAQYMHTSPTAITPPVTPNASPIIPERPQTAAYGLCDSPSGLLAWVHDAVRPQNNQKHVPETTQSQQQYPLSPQSSYTTSTSTPSICSSPSAFRRPSIPTTNHTNHAQTPWTPTALIDWTMLYWLPGPEIALRWLSNSTALLPAYWASHSPVPLALSHYHSEWTTAVEAYHRVCMVKRREGAVRFPAWEVPGDVVEDLREFVAVLGIGHGAVQQPQLMARY